MLKTPKVILLIETSRAFGQGLLRGIAKYVRIHEPWVFYRRTGGFVKNVDFLKSWPADGIILRNSSRAIDVIKHAIPAVYIIHHQYKLKNYPQVVTDGTSMGSMAAKYLLDRGYKNFAYCGFKNRPWSEDREENFCRQIHQEGFDVSVFTSRKIRLTGICRKSWKNSPHGFSRFPNRWA